MSDTPEHDPASSDQPDPPNPHSEELDIEGPNESAPGRELTEPHEHADERADASPSDSEQ